MISLLTKIKGLFFLLLFFLSIFLCIFLPIEIRNAVKSQSWEPRDLKIQSGEIIRTKTVTYRGSKEYRKSIRHHHSIIIIAKDLSNNKTVTITDIRYGDFPITFSVIGKIISSDHKDELERYPVGAEVVGYKDPKSEKYVLEKGDIVTPTVILIFAALWIIGNIIIGILYPKKKKENIIRTVLI